MKYIRTPFTIFEVLEETDIIYRVKAKGNPHNIYSKSKCQTEVVKSADTIEELCDEFVYYNVYQKRNIILSNFDEAYIHYGTINETPFYGAIWIKGEHGEPILKAVAKMNEKGELELL